MPPSGQATGPLRVLCVTPTGPDGRGGIDRLYSYLRIGEAPCWSGIDLRFVASRGPVEGALWPLAFPRHLAGIAWRLARFRPHIVHLNFANRGSAWRKVVILHLAKLFGARVAAHLHDAVPEAGIRSGSVEGRLFLAICRGADRLLVLGRPTADLVARHGVAPERIRVLLNGTPDFADAAPLPKGGAAGGPVEILLAGRLGPRKGAAILIEALALLAARGVDGWHCTIAGDGDVETYASLARERGLEDRIRFTGWLDSPAVHDLMRRADIVALPSLVEALPLSLIEGACAGAALLATDISNTSEIVVDGVNGHLLPRDPAAFADAIAGCLSDRARLGRLQVAARRHFLDAFTIEAFETDLCRIYTDLAGRAGTRGAASAELAVGERA
ncbi:glycosyltransferase involved in cell wall biosynthesis [Methylobacterium sp. BE186]|uniref:glycosyltransferase family 4 protein n=1 Tax=Methylobacterium sp. BE186 TaxID=2817715 RepID=UPI00285DBC83|nr:glycosyltransferase family 4 protein [Methylobacterium sp. BE186]MDR7037939.1 glycosyltransferase involved in cell wall biosynthesis [Methylobacterium sp. BE186]